jgi:hypothetical protein
VLPDYPETKALFSKFFQTRMRRMTRALSPLGTVDARPIHEGRELQVSRSDNTYSKSKATTISTLSSISIEAIRHLTFKQAIEHHDNLIREMVVKQAGFFAERLAADLPASQSVQATGRSLTAELILELFEKMEMEFNADGTAQSLNVMGGLFTPERLKEVEEEIRKSHDLAVKFETLFQKKRAAWRDREASRKLVG